LGVLTDRARARRVRTTESHSAAKPESKERGSVARSNVGNARREGRFQSVWVFRRAAAHRAVAHWFKPRPIHLLLFREKMPKYPSNIDVTHV
jgi:hypothetical protein